MLANGSHAASPQSAKLANRGSRVSDKVALVSAIEKIESVQYGAPDFKDAKELRAAFHEADEEVKTKARTAIDSQADVILALAKVQVILSQRGKEKMRRDAGIKLTWMLLPVVPEGVQVRTDPPRRSVQDHGACGQEPKPQVYRVREDW